jgi:nucleoid-associated protein YgaU
VLVLAVAGGAWALFGRDSSKDTKTGAIGPKVPTATATRVAGPVVPGKSVATTAPTTKPTATSVKPVATAKAVATKATTPAPTVKPTAAAVPTSKPSAAPTAKPVVTTPPVTAPQQGGTVTKKAFTFKVARGDTLWELTKQALSDTGRSTSNANVAAYVSKLYSANKSSIGSNPDLILVGQTISWPASL